VLLSSAFNHKRTTYPGLKDPNVFKGLLEEEHFLEVRKGSNYRETSTDDLRIDLCHVSLRFLLCSVGRLL